MMTVPEPPPIPRPKLTVIAWVIAIYYCATPVYALLWYSLMYSQALPMPEAQKQYFASLTWNDHITTAALYASNLLGGILLLLLRRHALYLFCLGFALGLFRIGCQIFVRHILSVLGPAALASLPSEWGIRFAVIFYTWRLIKRGVLR